MLDELQSAAKQALAKEKFYSVVKCSICGEEVVRYDHNELLVREPGWVTALWREHREEAHFLT